MNIINRVGTNFYLKHEPWMDQYLGQCLSATVRYSEIPRGRDHRSDVNRAKKTECNWAGKLEARDGDTELIRFSMGGLAEYIADKVVAIHELRGSALGSLSSSGAVIYNEESASPKKPSVETYELFEIDGKPHIIDINGRLIQIKVAK